MKLRRSQLVLGVVLGLSIAGGALYAVVGSAGSSDVGYHQSDELLTPYDLSKNPFKFNGKSGVLDTLRVHMLTPDGETLVAPYPGGGLRFEKMIDEHTATYSIMEGSDGYPMPEGEIAVLLDGSDPPKSSRLWRVYVLGTTDVVNGLGQDVTITTVKFEGYYTPPQKPGASSTPEPTLQPVTPQQPQTLERDSQPDNALFAEPASAGDHQTSDDTQAPAPIERKQEPTSSQPNEAVPQ